MGERVYYRSRYVIETAIDLYCQWVMDRELRNIRNVEVVHSERECGGADRCTGRARPRTGCGAAANCARSPLFRA